MTQTPNRQFFNRGNKKENLGLYEVLGVKSDATQSEIKKAFFQLAKKYHPDVNKEKDAQARYVKINEAYMTLSDENKRAIYD